MAWADMTVVLNGCPCPAPLRSRMAAGIRPSSPSGPRTPSSCPLSAWTTSLLPHQGSSTVLKLDLRASSDLDLLAPQGLMVGRKRKRRHPGRVPRGRWAQEQFGQPQLLSVLKSGWESQGTGYSWDPSSSPKNPPKNQLWCSGIGATGTRESSPSSVATPFCPSVPSKSPHIHISWREGGPCRLVPVREH